MTRTQLCLLRFMFKTVSRYRNPQPPSGAYIMLAKLPVLELLVRQDCII